MVQGSAGQLEVLYFLSHHQYVLDTFCGRGVSGIKRLIRYVYYYYYFLLRVSRRPSFVRVEGVASDFCSVFTKCCCDTMSLSLTQ